MDNVLKGHLYTPGFKFQHLVDEAPPTVRGYIDRLADVPQSWNWHPEGNVMIHTKILFERACTYNDPDLMLTAFFHDLGKVDTTVNNGKGGFSAHDHEDISAKLVKYNRGWIKELGGDPYKIEWLVKNHMRVKYLEGMKKSKREELTKHQWFQFLIEFRTCDSREGVTTNMVWRAGGCPIKFLWNKFKTLWSK